jgi:uncharacterized membrane protein YdjX (TVP38/TMEM64 family)
VLFVSVLIGTVILFQSVGVESIAAWVRSLGFFGPFLFVLIHTLSIVIAPLEGSVLMLASYGIFGNFWIAVGVVIVGGLMGSSINFWIARHYGKARIRKIIGPKMTTQIDRYTHLIDDHPLLLYPFMATTLFDIIGYAAGLTHIKYSRFMIAVLVSSLINVPIYVAIGAAFLNPRQGYEVMLVAGVVFIVLSLAAYLIKKYLNSQSS